MGKPFRVGERVLHPGQMVVPGAGQRAGRLPGCKPLPKRLPVQLLAMRWMGPGRHGVHHWPMLVGGPSPEWRQGDLLLSYPPPSERRPGGPTTELPAAIVHRSYFEKIFEIFSWRLNKRLGSSIKSNFHIFCENILPANVLLPQSALPLHIGQHSAFLRFSASMELPLISAAI